MRLFSFFYNQLVLNRYLKILNKKNFLTKKLINYLNQTTGHWAK